MMNMESRGWRRWSGRTLWVATTILALLILYFGLRTSMDERGARVAPHATYSLVVAAPRPGEELTILPAKQNESVTLRIRSDRAGEVHVHGYDQNVILKTGAEVVLTFTAKASGIYPIHLHERQNPADPDSPMLHRQLAVLKVEAE